MESLRNDISYDLSKLSLGFIGCGKISSAMVRGFCTLASPSRPQKIFVSKRSKTKSTQLQADYPDMIEISDSNEYIVRNSDVIFLGLLPQTAREMLPSFQNKLEGKFLFSIMAAVNIDEVIELTKIDRCNCAKVVPLPSIANHAGPILLFPQCLIAENILRKLGTTVVCKTELDMKPMISVAGHISPFYELMKVTQDFLLSKGISEQVSHDYVASFYAGLAAGANTPSSSFAHLTEEAATTGGLNEQALKYMRETDHFQIATQSLEAINQRLNK